MATETREREEANPFERLSEEEIEEIGREFQAVHDEVFEDLGERDAKYIRSIIGLHRRLALAGRVELFASRFLPTWLLGTSTLSLAKILENMEIGHNVLHGQWDWMNDPEINSSNWDWDTASPSSAWKHSHNYVHHTYTNVIGKDRDLGYEIMRIDPEQPWHPVYLLQPLYNLLLMAFFEWGVAVHDLDFTAIRAGNKKWKDIKPELLEIGRKGRDQVIKDYIAWPLVSAALNTAVSWALHSRDLDAFRRGRKARAKRRLRGVGRRVRRQEPDGFTLDVARETFKKTLWADFTANIVRNVWAHMIIFCGHFPDGTYTFTEDEYDHETKGGWYLRQLTGAANINGSALFHVISGNLGFQIEHHLYPDMPSTRYQEIAPRVREICERHSLPYNTGPLSKQFGSVMRTIARLAFPGGKPRPRPAPYRHEDAPESRRFARINGASSDGASEG